MDSKLSEIHSDLKIINSNKLSSNQGRLLLMGLTFELIQNKQLFPRNNDLKNFIKTIYEENLELEKEYRDYLYLSRTLLGSRVLKTLLIKDYDMLLQITNDLIEFLPFSSTENKSVSPRNSNSTDTDEWVNFLRGRSN
ncbi:hypothetical protein [Terribacillus sp. 7520-G]|uniref:hypothetical protein n=1 Tax=Terribacillus TaxID=459532 RepID=UPI000BA6E5E0|nr:hypothetical protein [Terribacillus sp. 7520-G]PAD38589.1 hypothetical protein CHH53_10170 [Terribacillus sp. 7520-G]